MFVGFIPSSHAVRQNDNKVSDESFTAFDTNMKQFATRKLSNDHVNEKRTTCGTDAAGFPVNERGSASLLWGVSNLLLRARKKKNEKNLHLFILSGNSRCYWRKAVAM